MYLLQTLISKKIILKEPHQNVDNIIENTFVSNSVESWKDERRKVDSKLLQAKNHKRGQNLITV